MYSVAERRPEVCRKWRRQYRHVCCRETKAGWRRGL